MRGWFDPERLPMTLAFLVMVVVGLLFGVKVAAVRPGELVVAHVESIGARVTEEGNFPRAAVRLPDGQVTWVTLPRRHGCFSGSAIRLYRAERGRRYRTAAQGCGGP